MKNKLFFLLNLLPHLLLRLKQTFEKRLFWKLFFLNFTCIVIILGIFATASFAFLVHGFKEFQEKYYESYKTEIPKSVSGMLETNILDENTPADREQNQRIQRAFSEILAASGKFNIHLIPFIVRGITVLNAEGKILFHGLPAPRHFFLNERDERENSSKNRSEQERKNNFFPGSTRGFNKKTEKLKKELREFIKEQKESDHDYEKEEDDFLLVTNPRGGSPVYVNIDGKRIFFTFFNGPKFLEKQIRSGIWIIIFCILFAFVLTFFINRFLIRQIVEINTGLKAIENQNFKARIPVKSKNELGTLARRFNDMAESMEGFENGRKQWISEISHELNTPLAVIRGEIEALIDGIRKRDNKNLHSILEEVGHLQKITEDLKILSIAESEKMNLVFENIALIPFVEEIIHRYEIRFEKAELKIVKNFQIPDSLTAVFDPYRMNQVLKNIFENCLKYSKTPGEIKITLSAKNSRLYLSIEDDGPGLNEEQMKKLFTRFYRSDDSRSRQTGGSGLGLAICRSLIKLHKGEIQAEKSSEGGLKINIELPLTE